MEEAKSAMRRAQAVEFALFGQSPFEREREVKWGCGWFQPVATRCGCRGKEVAFFWRVGVVSKLVLVFMPVMILWGFLGD